MRMMQNEPVIGTAPSPNPQLSSRHSIAEGFAADKGRQQQPASTSAPTETDSPLSAAISTSGAVCGSEGRLCCVEGEEDPGKSVRTAHSQPTHYGSTSTTFSTGSSNLTSSSCFGSPGGFLLMDQSSVASSSGVATMSSTDHLPQTASPPLSRSSADDSTPTMSTLTGGAAVLRRELEPLLSGAASTLASSSALSSAPCGVSAATAFSSLSLNHSSQPVLAGAMAPCAALASVPCADHCLLGSQAQTQSTPSLIMANNPMWTQQDCSAPQATASSCDELAAAKGNCTDENAKAKATPTSSPRQTANAGMAIANQQQQQNPLQMPHPPASSSPGQLSLLAATPLPSVFNCAATSCSQIICTPLRTIVSQNRRRYQMDGFNLDLTYITDRIIAMGYPADTREALYRNSMSHIVKFLEHYHPGHYKVFNLRGQYVYDPANFHNRVVSFEMTDHHPPRLELMAPFCREVHEYLDADPQNVVAVHCKAGKGRTGVMICAYLCYIAFYNTPRQNMDYYSIIRTHNNKGVTIPSQRRYVYYFSHLRERKLNYMPLRCELVGIYLERPPKLSGPLSKGALKLRVAVGDVDVFLGDELWLNGDKFEEEEELFRRYPLLTGDDHYDPIRPDPLKNCISRRCYGWTVPQSKRVFLEGDIRVDIFQKSQLKLFNVKQERKKIGHLWLNTMFTCPGFCGGQYVHGDEAYAYPEAMIVRRRFKHTNQQTQGGGGTEQLQHPCSAPTMVESGSEGEKTDGATESARERQTSLRFGAFKLSNGGSNSKKQQRNSRSPARQLIEAEQKGWQSQDGDTSSSSSAQQRPPKGNAKQGRSSMDASGSGEASGWEEEIVVERPPGLDRHCPEHTLGHIYSSEKQAPRYGIDEMIRDAYYKNLINDLYNTRRMSQPRDGPPIPKAPMGRPSADGPYCVMRASDEHVSVFGVQEIDRAYKNKDIDTTFKVFFVTRCVDEQNSADVRLAEHFVRVTRQKQAQKDAEKAEKMEQRQRKVQLTAREQNAAAANYAFAHSDSNAEQASCSSSVGSASIASSTGPSGVQWLQQGATSPQTQRQSVEEDPRLGDPHLRKYFFRQRVTSQSRHPSVHHHCSLRPPDARACAKYACCSAGTHVAAQAEEPQTGTGRRRSSAGRRLMLAETKMEEATEADVEEEIEEEEEEDDTSFDGFDFFHPRQPTCSTMRGSGGKSATGNKEETSLQECSAKLATVVIEQQEPLRSSSGSIGAQSAPPHQCRSNSNNLAARAEKWPNGQPKLSTVSGSTCCASLSSAELTEPEVYHPSDCSLAPSSGSSCSSSSDSLENQQPPPPQTQQLVGNQPLAEQQELPPAATAPAQAHRHHHHRRHSSQKSGGEENSSRERK